MANHADIEIIHFFFLFICELASMFQVFEILGNTPFIPHHLEVFVKSIFYFFEHNNIILYGTLMPRMKFIFSLNYFLFSQNLNFFGITVIKYVYDSGLKRNDQPK